jgi:hypothetical protein
MTRVVIGHPLNTVLSYSAAALHSAVPPGRGLRLWISRPEQPSRHKQHERTGHCKHAEATRRGRVLVVGVVSVRACPAQTRRVLFAFREASKARINGMIFWKHRVSGKRLTRKQVRDDDVHHHARDNPEHDTVCKAAGRVNRGS